MGKIIHIDAGHGGKDSGAVNGSRYEKSDNYRLALAVGDKLRTQKQTVVLTRATDASVSLAERTRIANASAADLFVSLHRNSAQKKDAKGNLLWNPDGTPVLDPTAKGVEIWVHTTPTAAELGAACEVLEQLAAVGVQSNRGVKKGIYHVCRETKMPAMLIELGFISNAKDNELFDVNFDAYATAITKGILEALGEPYIEPGTQKEAPAQGLYRVQVGAFGVKENAEAFLQAVKDMGLKAFLVIPDTPKNEE